MLLYGAEDYSTPATVGTANNWNNNYKLSDYDRICVVTSNDTDLQSNVVWNAFYDTAFLLDSIGLSFSYCQYWQRVVAMTFTDTTFTVTSSSAGQETSGYTPKVYKIYGYKL